MEERQFMSMSEKRRHDFSRLNTPNLHRLITVLLREKQPVGMTGVELVLACADAMIAHQLDHDDFQRAICSLLDEGNIREEEYTNPGMEYRIKSRYFFVKYLDV